MVRYIDMIKNILYNNFNLFRITFKRKSIDIITQNSLHHKQTPGSTAADPSVKVPEEPLKGSHSSTSSADVTTHTKPEQTCTESLAHNPKHLLLPAAMQTAFEEPEAGPSNDSIPMKPLMLPFLKTSHDINEICNGIPGSVDSCFDIDDEIDFRHYDSFGGIKGGLVESRC